MTVAKILVVLLGSALIINGQNSGPVGKFKIEYYVPCKDFEQVEGYNYEAQLKNTDNGKAFDFTFSIKEDIGPGATFLLNVDRFNNGVWEENFYSADGDIMANIKQYIPKVFENVRAKLDPPVSSENSIPAGDYKLVDFQDVEGSLSLPSIFYGKFRAFMYFSVNDQDIFCGEFGADSQAG